MGNEIAGQNLSNHCESAVACRHVFSSVADKLNYLLHHLPEKMIENGDGSDDGASDDDDDAAAYGDVAACY